ncbi:MAG: hypothetical protein V3S11_04930 [Elusimicrobiota bacterium]
MEKVEGVELGKHIDSLLASPNIKDRYEPSRLIREAETMQETIDEVTRGITGIALSDRPAGLDGYDDDYDEYFKNFILTPDGRIVNFDPIAAHGW